MVMDVCMYVLRQIKIMLSYEINE